MSSVSLIVKVPGKLMIAGEYAVLEPNQKCVVVAVNRYVTASIKPSSHYKISLPEKGLKDVAWEINNEGIQFSVSDTVLDFVENSISTAIQYLKEKSVKLSPFQLEVISELDDTASGKKYGLGSSAAVVTAVIYSIMHFHSRSEEEIDLEDIFKLSTIAHFRVQGSGSGADIAAATYGGWLEYSAFNSNWLLSELNKGRELTELIGKPWPNLIIRFLTPPSLLQLAVGWTKEAASTAAMIKKYQSFHQQNIETYSDFIRESSNSVNQLIRGFDTDDYKKSVDALAQNRRALVKLGENAGVHIETEKLKILCNIAEIYGSGKSSGAGGGDCGIAFVRNYAEKEKLCKAWEAAGIFPLDLTVTQEGILLIEGTNSI
jgi:phosphomevalonate kinase